jgi:hypothetical protein
VLNIEEKKSDSLYNLRHNQSSVDLTISQIANLLNTEILQPKFTEISLLKE